MLLVLGIGTNLGNRQNNLEEAIKKLTFLKSIKRSEIIETSALLQQGAPKNWNKPFLNMAVAGLCSMKPEKILEEIKQIEFLLGRKPGYKKWSPRVIDIDILLYGEMIYSAPNLHIPHPGLFERDFALLPAKEIAGELVEKVERVLNSKKDGPC